MTIADLIAELQKLPQDAVVLAPKLGNYEEARDGVLLYEVTFAAPEMSRRFVIQDENHDDAWEMADCLRGDDGVDRPDEGYEEAVVAFILGG